MITTMTTETIYRIEYLADPANGWIEWDFFSSLEEKRARQTFSSLVDGSFFTIRKAPLHKYRLVKVEISHTETAEVLE